MSLIHRGIPQIICKLRSQIDLGDRGELEVVKHQVIWEPYFNSQGATINKKNFTAVLQVELKKQREVKVCLSDKNMAAGLICQEAGPGG